MVATSSVVPVAYRAFLSYSHADERKAARLHRQLETWRIPPKLSGSTTLRGTVPDRLSPIFRDREELSAGDDLSAQVQAALAASDALLVLCSPAARASRWVNREIELFRALHPDRPILAAILEGDPDTAFPPALTAHGNEPIAADLRKDKDGARLGLLKLVAGLTGLPLDSLVQRDAQRQMRRVMAITGMALAGMLAMGLLTIMAAQARNEAQTQRQQAEGLVEYMLTDLRDRLKGVGRLDVMTAVNERAIAYYGAQGSLEALPPESLERRARILHAMGEDDETRGDMPRALTKFSEAHRATAAVLALRPHQDDALFAHAQSEYWVGYAAFRQKNYAKARTHFEAYRTLAARLIALDPRNPDWQREAGYADGNLCTLALMSGSSAEDRARPCQASLDRMKAVMALKPGKADAMLDVANRHAWLSDHYERNKDFTAALDQRMRQLALYQQVLKADPRDADTLEQKIGGEIETARLEKTLGQAAAATARRTRARAELDRLVALEPANKRWRMLLEMIEELK